MSTKIQSTHNSNWRPNKPLITKILPSLAPTVGHDGVFSMCRTVQQIIGTMRLPEDGICSDVVASCKQHQFATEGKQNYKTRLQTDLNKLLFLGEVWKNNQNMKKKHTKKHEENIHKIGEKLRKNSIYVHGKQFKIVIKKLKILIKKLKIFRKQYKYLEKIENIK